MHARIVAVALAFLLITGNVALAQTPEIQKEIQKKLGELKKEKAKLDELLTLALKNNADIRVAESKLRDAEMSLYRTRMQILEKVVMLSHEIAAARAAADEAMYRYQRDKALFDKAGLAASELAVSAAAAQKSKSDLARVEAQMEFLTGGNNHKEAVEKGLLWLSRSVAASNPPRNVETPPNPIPAAMAAKILKALHTPVKLVAGAFNGEGILELLREHAKGINILDHIANPGVEARLQLKEAIPLGAFFEWAEDQFHWRFVIRDYGIVATDRDSVPPAGAMLLLDLWRRSKDAGAAQ